MTERLLEVTRLVVFCLAVFALSSCSETSIANGNNSQGSPTPPKTGSRSSEYPPLASGLAEAEFELLDGTKFRVSEKKGKVLLLNIWGTWCGPCREEMPHLVELQEKLGPQGLEVIGFNIGNNDGSPEPTEDIKAFAEKMNVNYTMARSAPTSTLQFYKVTKQQVVPQTFLVDRNGHLRGVFIGGGARVLNSMKENLIKTMNEG